MENFAKIKTELLKSGLPLESTVAEIISGLSPKLRKPLLNLGEHYFQRRESELPSSVDFAVTYDLDIEGCDFVQIVFLIECKYRTKGTSWFFVGNPEGDAGMEFFMENFFSSYKCNRKTFPSLVPPLNDEKMPIAGKGTEVYAHGQGNEKSINEALHQLMFASSSSLVRAFFRADDERLVETYLKRGVNIRGRSFHSLLCPIVATTANLYFLMANLEKVEQSDKLEDFCTREETVVYSSNPPPYLAKYTTDVVFENIKPLLPIGTIEQRVQTYLIESSIFFPSRYYFIDYKNIEDFMRKYIDLASSLLIYACRSKG